jgi:carboxymethylenebutenolidase
MSTDAAQGSTGEQRPQAAGEFRLLAADGNQPMAYFSPSLEGTGGVGMVVIHAMRGLEPFYKVLTGRLAEAGINAVAFDFYGRVAPDDRRDESFDFASYYEYVRVPEAFPGLDADVAAAIDFLRSPLGGSATSVFTLGFCFGASVSWWQSAQQPGLSGCIGLYGGPRYVYPFIPAMQRPLLVLTAGADAFVSRDEMEKFEAELAAAKVRFRSKTYPGAPHSFFDRNAEQHPAAAADAWKEILEFIGEWR